MLDRVLRAIFEAEISSDPEDVKGFMEAFDRVKPMMTPKTRRLLNMAALALNLAPLTSKFKPLTSMSPRERRLWLGGVGPESLTKDLAVMLEFVALAVYAGFSGRFQARIEYDRLRRVSKVEARAPKISRKGRPLDSYDVIVVGSGAGGAVAAWELARRGFKVVVFEAGPEPPPGEFIGEPPVVRAVRYYWDSGVTFTWGTPAVNIPFGRVLGGTVTLNSGTLFRVPGEALSLWGKASGARVDSGLLEWAYRVVEEKLQAKPVPEHLLGGNAIVMRRGAEALGLKHYPVTRPLGSCLGLGECAFGCPSGGKIDMRLSFLREAVEMGAHVYVEAEVEKIIIKGSKARGVIVRVEGSRLEVGARVIIVSAGALNTPRLLAASGVKNRNLGKHLHIHPAVGVTALMNYKVRGWEGTMQSYCVEDLLREHHTLLLATFPPPGIGYSAGSLPLGDLDQYEHLASIGVQSSDENTGEVSTRIPLGAAKYNISKQDLEKLKTGIKLSTEILIAAGALKVYPPIKKPASATNTGELEKILENTSPKTYKLSAYHPMSTARMSGDPETGVVDVNGRVYEIENLYIADASILPSTTIVNPQLTINALSLIIASNIAKEMRGPY